MKYNYNFIVLDTETGGLPSKTKLATIDIALTEVAVVVIDNESLEVTHKDSWLMKPYDDSCEYNPRAAEVSGITKQMCKVEGLEIEQVYKNLLKVLKANKKGRLKPIMVMQNKGFDIPFIENLFAIFNDNFHNYIECVEDTLEWGRYKWIEKPNFKLGSLADYCGLDLVQAHRALPDTVMTAKIWIHFMKCLRGEGQEVQEESVAYRENFKF